ncbi:hypothetical protein MUP79_02970 [Candidatus Bathyarchaeota archaeon]|nr:hypothetical protein [Candidatus Bathyarchaeota archaeon]
MRLRKTNMAIANLLMILLILASLIIGALISYMWVMAAFWNMPQNVTTMVVEDVVFPSEDFTYFNVTVINPSNSISDLNLTAFKVVDEAANQTYDVPTTDPAVPFNMTIGTRQTFMCLKNWGDFAGESVRIEPVAGNTSILSGEYVPPQAKLVISGFNASQNIQYFNLTVQNYPLSVMNLTISEITVQGLPVTNTTPALPFNLSKSQGQDFQVRSNWGNRTGQNLTIVVKTAEGLEQTYVTPTILGAHAYVGQPNFDYNNSTYFNVTVRSAPESTAETTLSALNLTLSNGTTITPMTNPLLNVLPIKLPSNNSQLIICLWDWTAYRNQSFTVQVFTKEGFSVQNTTATTPPAILWNLGDIKFDVGDLQHFSVNVTNMLASVQAINVTGVDFNQSSTTITPTVVAPGSQNTVQCTYNWTDFVGSSIGITVHATYDAGQISISQTAKLPYFGIANASFSNFSTGNPYLNITVYDSQYSKTNATIVQISVNAGNSTFVLDGTIANPKIGTQGYTITPAGEVTFTCPWDRSPYLGKDVTIIVTASDDSQVSTTLKVE